MLQNGGAETEVQLGVASESRFVTDTASLLVSKGLNVLLIIHKVSNWVNLANPPCLQPAGQRLTKFGDSAQLH